MIFTLLSFLDMSVSLITGGFTNGGIGTAEIYNPATNTWSPIVAMMSRRSGVSTYG